MTEVNERGLRAFLSSSFGRLPRVFWVIWSGVLVTRMGAMVVPFLTLYLTTHQHLSIEVAGLAVTAIGLGSTSAQFVGGVLADLWGRRVVFTVGPAAAALALLALGYVRGVPLTLIAAFLVGLTLRLYEPASSAVIADRVPAEHRPRAYGLLFWAVNAGFAVAAVLGGVLARQGFGWLFWIDSLTCLAFGLIVRRWLPADKPREKGPKTKGQFRVVLRDWVMLAYVGLLLVHASVQFQVSSTLSLAMTEKGLSAADFGVAAAVNGALVVLVQPFIVNRLGKLDRSAVIAAGAFLIGLGYGLTAFPHSVFGYVLTIAIWTAGEIAISAVVQTVVAELAPPELRGRYFGVFGAAYALAAMIAPAWGTAVLTAFGQNTLWATCFALGTLAALGQLALGPRIRARRDQLQDSEPVENA